MTESELADWIQQYCAQLPNDEAILAQIAGNWEEFAFRTLQEWRLSGEESEFKYIKFCLSVKEAVCAQYS